MTSGIFHGCKTTLHYALQNTLANTISDCKILLSIEKEKKQSNIKPEQKATKGHKVREHGLQNYEK